MNSKLYFLIVLIVFSCSDEKKQASKPKYEASFLLRDEINLGDIYNDEIQPIQLTVRNPSARKVTIAKISKSCGCTDIASKSRTINPKSNLEVLLKYNPKNDSGKVNRTIMLRMSDDSFLAFNFKANVSKN